MSLINRERLIETLLELVEINAPSRREGPMAQWVSEALARLGATVTIDDAGAAIDGEVGNVLARLGGTLDGPPLLFCAHLDTVEPTAALTVQRQDGVITSDGSTILGADDRAGVAAIIEMARTLAEQEIPHPPLELLFTVAEEVGLMGSAVLAPGLLSAACGFVPDTTGSAGIIIARGPAQQQLKVTIHGRAAHAGVSPEDGVNAITVASKAIARMRQGRLDEETTANIGTIRGGKATNIIPDCVEIEGEARSRDPQKLQAQTAHMVACFEEEAGLAGARAEVTVTDVYPAFNLDADSLPVRLAREAMEGLEIPVIVTATGGGSDANFLNAYGIPSVILSTGYQHPHCTNERQDEDELVKLTETLVEIVRRAR